MWKITVNKVLNSRHALIEKYQTHYYAHLETDAEQCNRIFLIWSPLLKNSIPNVQRFAVKKRDGKIRGSVCASQRYFTPSKDRWYSKSLVSFPLLAQPNEKEKANISRLAGYTSSNRVLQLHVCRLLKYVNSQKKSAWTNPEIHLRRVRILR